MANSYVLPSSTYLDFTSYGSGADLPTPGSAAASLPINVALVLERANDPTAFLEGDWAARQTMIAQQGGDLWTTYGASSQDYTEILAYLQSYGFTILGTGGDGYVTSQDSRTIWVQVASQQQWQSLFGATLQTGTVPSTAYASQQATTMFWSTADGSDAPLALPADLSAVKGLFFDFTPWQMAKESQVTFQPIVPAPQSGAKAASLPQGPQSPGNSGGSTEDTTAPQDIAGLYGFPAQLAGFDTAGVTIGLIEPGLGDAVPSGSTGTFSQLLTDYLDAMQVDGSVEVIGVAPGGTPQNSSAERSIDVSIVAAINPASTQVLYAGSGSARGAQSNPWTAYHAAIWDTVNDPAVVSSSFVSQLGISAPGSPFAWAAEQLFIDAALRNITMLGSSGDEGAGYGFANGRTNVPTAAGSPYNLMVGGTSLSTEVVADGDDTLKNAWVAPALAGDLATLWQLMRGGMTAMPTAGSSAWLIETVWNQYHLEGNTFDYGYLQRLTGSGGTDPAYDVPAYQKDFGLTSPLAPVSLRERGMPDVAALSGGNMYYDVLGADMSSADLTFGAGTSASTPLWASLIAQIDAVFADQQLPNLGYMTDLLYTAAAIAPGSFNDITIGNNVSSFLLGGSFTAPEIGSGAEVDITPTGLGYLAGPGYDLTTGLGSPNGMLLARALTWIAHSQMFFGQQPDLIDGDDSTGWRSGADQTLLFQTMSADPTEVEVVAGANGFTFSSPASEPYAWTAQLADQVLQPDFDPKLVVLFDNYSQGAVAQSSIGEGDALSVSIDSSQGLALQGSLTSRFGFADFVTIGGDVRVARPVAIAETAGGQDAQFAIVRIRHNGVNDDSLTFYRVDDLNGTIDGIVPGHPLYALAAQARAYHMTTGGTSIDTSGYGAYSETALEQVNAGDLIAMKLDNKTTGQTFWGFAQANEIVDGQPTPHLWSYGANIWGWEDQYGGGDGDYTDPVFQLDFTSASGSGWLM